MNREYRSDLSIPGVLVSNNYFEVQVFPFPANCSKGREMVGASAIDCSYG